MPKPIEDLKKTIDPIINLFTDVDAKAIDYKVNNMKSFAKQFPLQMNELAEQIAEAMSAGVEGKSVKDFEKVKEVRLWISSLRSTYLNLLGEIEDFKKYKTLGTETKRKSDKYKKEVAEAAGQASKPDEKRKMSELKRLFDLTLTKIDLTKDCESKIPKEAKEIAGKKLDDFFKEAIAKAEKMPKKAAKELPKEMSADAFTQKEKELTELEKELKSFPSKIKEAMEKGQKEAEKRKLNLRRALIDDKKEMDELNEERPPRPERGAPPEAMKAYEKAMKEWDKKYIPVHRRYTDNYKEYKSLGTEASKDKEKKAETVAKMVEGLEEKARKLISYADELKKTQKTHSVTLKASKFAAKFDTVQDKARKVARQMLDEVKSQKKGLKEVQRDKPDDISKLA